MQCRLSVVILSCATNYSMHMCVFRIIIHISKHLLSGNCVISTRDTNMDKKSLNPIEVYLVEEIRHFMVLKTNFHTQLKSRGLFLYEVNKSTFNFLITKFDLEQTYLITEIYL